jgi:hypothetical protein
VAQKRQSVTYGHFSKSQRVNQCNASEKVVYGPQIVANI